MRRGICEFESGIIVLVTYSLYIHVPFCKHRCYYCDFITFSGKESVIPAYVDALIREFRVVTNNSRSITVHSIYFGGGTPSLISALLFEKILDAISDLFDLCENCEITIEANPGSLTHNYLKELVQLGVNRLSLGVQSTDPIELRKLDRVHDVSDTLKAVGLAREAGIKNLSFDMIFGLPGQRNDGWINSLKRAISLKPEHLSLYSLIIEPATPLGQWYRKGMIEVKNEDREADMYENAMRLLAESGYQHYEISNWAACESSKDFQCRHNLQYWHNQPYLGFGVGAHGYADGTRTENTTSIHDYIKRLSRTNSLKLLFPNSPANISSEAVDHQTQMKDFMMLGLRLVEEGVSADRFEQLFNQSMTAVFKDEITNLLKLGLIEWGDMDEKKLRLTKYGVMVANQVFMAFI